MATKKTPEELQAWLSESTEDPIQLALQKEELTNQNKTLKESIDAMTQTISDNEASKAADDEAHKSAIEAKDEEIAGINSNMESLKAKVVELENEINALTESNANLIAEAHQALAEKIVDMKISNGKASKESKEEQMSIYVARSNESLNDTLADLLAELANAPVKAEKMEPGTINAESIPPDVTNTAKGENVQTVVEPEVKKTKFKTVSTDEEAIKSMLNQKR